MTIAYTDVPEIVATDLDQAWLNFEPDTPLPSKPDGTQHPFYVHREHDPIGALRLRLNRKMRVSPKYFLSGHRGCGKSTELLRLMVHPNIQAKYIPIFFSIREHADIFDIDYRDILLIMGSQMFTQFERIAGTSLPAELLSALDQWRGTVEESVVRLKEGRTSGQIGSEVGGGVGSSQVATFFGKISGVIKIEPAVRREVRQHFKHDITSLLSVLDLIAAQIEAFTQKKPLLLIDDLDKLDLKFAREIFHERQQIMLRPKFPIIYTISSSLYYTPECSNLGSESFFVPNVKLHAQGDASAQDTDGMRVMNRLLNQRIDNSLLTTEARDLLLRMSGGVFRELGHLVQIAVDHATLRGATQIEGDDVEQAAAELRSTYWRVLTAEQRDLLREVRVSHQMVHPDQLAPLFQILAVLEYRNGNVWCDVHPVLEYLLEQLADADEES